MERTITKLNNESTERSNHRHQTQQQIKGLQNQNQTIQQQNDDQKG